MGTQAVAEAVFNYQGVGTLFIDSLSSGAPNGFPLVAVFPFMIAVLIGAFCADVVAAMLDPRLREGSR